MTDQLDKEQSMTPTLPPLTTAEVEALTFRWDSIADDMACDCGDDNCDENQWTALLREAAATVRAQAAELERLHAQVHVAAGSRAQGYTGVRSKMSIDDQLDKWWRDASASGDTLLEKRNRFAELVVAAEREACAKVCEETTAAWTEYLYNDGCMDCADAIRKRGEK